MFVTCILIMDGREQMTELYHVLQLVLKVQLIGNLVIWLGAGTLSISMLTEAQKKRHITVIPQPLELISSSIRIDVRN